MRRGLQGVRRGKGVRTTVPDSKAVARSTGPPEFRAERPNQLWVADFTPRLDLAGLAVRGLVVDVFARYIVGWRVSSRCRTDFVLDALEQALASASPGESRDGTLPPQDRGQRNT